MSNAFPPLPRACDADGKPRLCGVEIEFAGLTETAAARCVQATLGGETEDAGPHDVIVRGTELGKIAVELDTVLRKTALPGLQSGLDLARGLVPVEIITEPVAPGDMPRLNTLCAALRREGALGSRDGLLLGFGVHLNPAVTAMDDPYTCDTVLAYGLVEDWLRMAFEIDGTRRLLPFVDPWPRGLVDDLAAARATTLDEVRSVYAAHTQSRNHGLDLLPLLKQHDERAYEWAFDLRDKTSARPAFHFRLPDCRIDEASWSLAEPWKMWLLVERAADNAALLDALCAAWLQTRDRWFTSRRDWAELSGRILHQHGAVPA